MKTIAEISALVEKIKYLDWDIMVLISPEGRPYLQVHGHGPCPESKQDESWSGRKWWLSYHMTTNEVIRTAHFAVQGAVLHEMNEHFTYRGVRIFDPHMDYDRIVDLASQPGFLDVRNNGLQGE